MLVFDKELQMRLKYIQKNIYQNFMFTGPSGTGKTSFAKKLFDKFCGNKIMINASNERSIQNMNHAELTKNKLVILDECDNLTPQIQYQLMQVFKSDTKIILICNYRDKILPELKDQISIVYFKQGPEEIKQILINKFGKYNEQIVNDCRDARQAIILMESNLYSQNSIEKLFKMILQKNINKSLEYLMRCFNEYSVYNVQKLLLSHNFDIRLKNLLSSVQCKNQYELVAIIIKMCK